MSPVDRGHFCESVDWRTLTLWGVGMWNGEDWLMVLYLGRWPRGQWSPVTYHNDFRTSHEDNPKNVQRSGMVRHQTVSA